MKRISWDISTLFVSRVSLIFIVKIFSQLRRSMLHQYLSNQSRSPITTSNSVAASFSTPPMPPMPSPSLQGTSPSGSRLTFSSFSRESPASTNGGVSPGVGKRKSSFGLNIGRKSEADGMKLPKEFLMEFWGTLANEDGDAGWKTATGSFLGMIKKGTKTPSGMNLREIPTLLEGEFDYIECGLRKVEFMLTTLSLYRTSSPYISYLRRSPCPSIPSPTAPLQFPPAVQSFLPDGSSAIRERQRSALSPPRRGSIVLTGRESRHHFRLHLQRVAVPNGLNGGSTKSPAGGTGLGRAHSDQSGHSQDSIRRKPSPVWNGDQDGVMGEMMETVGQVWGVAREVMKKDVAGAQRSGPLDQVGFSPAASR